MEILRVMMAFVACVLVAEALAATASTQFVLHELGRLGVAVSFADRVDTTAHDIIGMLPIFGIIIGIGFAIALPVAWLLSRPLPQWRTPLFAAAGFTAIVVAHFVLNKSLSITPVAGARTGLGVLVQGFAGALAGLLYTRLSPRPAA